MNLISEPYTLGKKTRKGLYFQQTNVLEIFLVVTRWEEGMGVQVLLVFTGNRLGILPSFNAQDNLCNKESSSP